MMMKILVCLVLFASAERAQAAETEMTQAIRYCKNDKCRNALLYKKIEPAAWIACNRALQQVLTDQRSFEKFEKDMTLCEQGALEYFKKLASH